MNRANQHRELIRKTLLAGVLLFGLSVILAACGSLSKTQAWPEETVRSAAQAFVDGYNRGDLGAFDGFFASPAQGADPAGLARTKDAAHELLAQAQPGSTMQLLSLAIISQQPADPQALASIGYRARLGLRNGQHILSTKAVEQTVQLEQIRNKWLIIDGDEPRVTNAPANAVAPSPEASVPTDSAPASIAAMQMLANSLRIVPTQIKVVSSEALSWPNACLGVTQLGVMCKPGETPGFRFILQAGGQRYEYHTDSNGLYVRPGREGPVVASAVAESAARKMHANVLGISVDQVGVVSSTLMEWPDTCLGTVVPGNSCNPGVTPGYLITLEAEGQRVEYHTNADTTVIAQAAAL